MKARFIWQCLFVLLGAGLSGNSWAEDRPNVILIMTDDQGYGDLACHGNPTVKTPALDELYRDSVRLTDYHVDPTCSPTRSALLTGRYSTRTGVWHTIQGRSLLSPEEVTLGELFQEGGYRTGIFGKWHLGDNFPSRPQDQGFQEALVHGGGGVGQTPDYFGNSYMNDTYFHNGKPTKFTGYCTDIWFNGALNFIEANREQPFFVYLPTNAAHGPYRVPEKYSQPYKEMGVPSPQAEFYGMITNIDENVARLRKQLKEWGLDRNTLLIFTTDNGTSAGQSGKFGFNAGMRGAKGSEYEGGHRVPCFFHWPAGELTGGRDVDTLTAHIDLLPTLADLCQLTLPQMIKLDGRSLRPELQGTEKEQESRILFVHSQRVEIPQKWKSSSVMFDHWRLVNKTELYDLKIDPGQKHNIMEQHPELGARLVAAYEDWWNSLKPVFSEYVRIELGGDENPADLTCHDWHEPTNGVPWDHSHIRKDLPSNGFWAVDIARAGNYEITLRTRPDYAPHPLEADSASLEIGQLSASGKVMPTQTTISFRLALTAGPAKLKTTLKKEGKPERGAYFVEVKYLGAE